MMLVKVPLPMFYNGWIIQYHEAQDGYFVYPRIDSQKPADILFEDLQDAKDYIMTEIKGDVV